MFWTDEILKIWRHSDYAKENYIEEPFDEASLNEVQEALGYQLPESYVDLMKHQNGGLLKDVFVDVKIDRYETRKVQLGGLYAIHMDQIVDENHYAKETYPDIGVYIGDLMDDSDEHIALDYGYDEPKVVFISEAYDYEKTVIAESFELFVTMILKE